MKSTFQLHFYKILPLSLPYSMQSFNFKYPCLYEAGNKALTAVWDISTWERIGHKRLLRKPASKMSVSLDGKYLAL